MSSNPAGKIKIVTWQDQETDESRSNRTRLVTKALDVGVLREHFQSFMQQLQSIIAINDEHVGPFRLNEIQFSAEITGNGEFRLLGTGVSVEASSAITFVLQRESKT
ncbi:MAG TPA: hypothetical protein VLA19_02420 [Herpetosiphonaceae bacterium]|nr:hypothetical protein [Herpetosiphonaceae bacterium]